MLLRPITYSLKRGPVSRFLASQIRQVSVAKKISIDFNELPEITKNTGPAEEETDIETTRHIAIDDDRGAKAATSSLFKTIRSLIERYADHVVFVQVGSFYELYFEQAVNYGPLCDLKVASRSYKTWGTVPFAGFPLHSLNKYLKILVNDHGLSVAIAEQYVTALETGRIKRRVVRIVTPGTLIDEALRNFQENNYLLAISFPEDPCKRTANPDLKIGLAWCDVGLGEFYIQETNLKDLMTNISRIKPSEILFDEQLEKEKLDAGRWYPDLAELKRYHVKYQGVPKAKSMKAFYDMFNSSRRALDICFNDFSQKEISASVAILAYISEHLPEAEANLAIPQRQIAADLMQIDSRTSDALELHRSYRDNKAVGSFLASIKYTVTPAGTRLLSSWISAPSTSVSEIQKRQRLAELFRKKNNLRTTVIHYLKLSSDMSRIVQRLSLGRVDVSEICSLSKTLFVVNEIKSTLQAAATTSAAFRRALAPILEHLNAPAGVAENISATIDEEAVIRSQNRKDTEKEILAAREESTSDDHALDVEGWVIRKNANVVLRRCHSEYEELLDKKEEFLRSATELFKNKHKCRAVDLQLHKVYGFVLYVTGSQKNLSAMNDLPSSYHLLYSTKQARYFYHKSWKHIGTDIQSHVDRIKAEEESVLAKLKKDILLHTNEIRSVAHCIDILDVLSSFAVLASEKNMIMPKVTSGSELEIIQGRHPVAEEGLKETSQEFTPNDCLLNSQDGKKLWVISGPNMGGKSTFLRQNALIVIMAQIGCFVPAEKATIGIVDKVFSRVGSADDLYRELSTFMVEMVETSFILNNATARSLAILDEVGRGTSGKEGLAIAYATLLYLMRFNNSRTLFATHFGLELARLLNDAEDIIPHIGYYHTTLEKVEASSKFVFEHSLKEGISKQSYAVEVAEIAGLPTQAIDSARKILQRIDSAPEQ